MKSIRNWFLGNWKNILKVVAIIFYVMGAIAFGKRVWKVDFNHEWQRWLATIIGQLVFLYSITFGIAAIALSIAVLWKKEDISMGIKVALMCVGMECIFQQLFWGIIYSNMKNLLSVIVIAALMVILFLMLKKETQSNN